MLFIDVNIGKEKGLKRLIIYEDDSPNLIANKFGQRYELAEQKIEKLRKMLAMKVEDHRQKLRG